MQKNSVPMLNTQMEVKTIHQSGSSVQREIIVQFFSAV